MEPSVNRAVRRRAPRRAARIAAAAASAAAAAVIVVSLPGADRGSGHAAEEPAAAGLHDSDRTAPTRIAPPSYRPPVGTPPGSPGGAGAPAYDMPPSETGPAGGRTAAPAPEEAWPLSSFSAIPDDQAPSDAAENALSGEALDPMIAAAWVDHSEHAAAGGLPPSRFPPEHAADAAGSLPLLDDLLAIICRESRGQPEVINHEPGLDDRMQNSVGLSQIDTRWLDAAGTPPRDDTALYGHIRPSWIGWEDPDGDDQFADDQDRVSALQDPATHLRAMVLIIDWYLRHPGHGEWWTPWKPRISDDDCSLPGGLFA